MKGEIFLIINAKEVSFDYIRRNELGEVEAVNRALDNINMDIEEGEFIAILGHNGSGKSTFAKHLNAILVPTEGYVLIDGNDTTNYDEVWNIRQTAGMVFQNPDNNIIASVVEEDVGFGPENLGIPTDEIWQRVEESLKAVGMYDYRQKSPNALSGGQKQRVSIAGILAMKPKCIILDEPTAMLDPKGRQEVIQAAKELNKKDNITIILVTHYLDEVVDADRIFVMDKGKVALCGTPKEVFSEVDSLEALHLELPQVTKLAYMLSKKGISYQLPVLSVEEFIEQSKRLVTF